MMADKMKRVIFGYNKREVMDYISQIKTDYEDELTRKQDRMMELLEENRNLKVELKRLEEKLLSYEEKEECISKALVKAERKAQDIINDGHRKAREERYKIELEKRKWEDRVKTIRKQILDFERIVCETLEEFRAEVNYLASKEISDALLCDEDEFFTEDREDGDIRSVS